MPKKKHRLPPNVHIRKDGAYEIRVTYMDAQNKRRALHEVTKDIDKEYIAERVNQMKGAIDRKRLGMPLRPVPISMESVIRRFVESELQPAIYRNGKKVSGRKSVKDDIRYARLMSGRWGTRNPRNITYAELKSFKAERLTTPIKYKRATKPRAISTVNREMQFLRAVFNYALREGWIDRNPFNQGRPLIRLSDESARDTKITLDEERELLSLCTGAREHLKPILICILYGGFRSGEILGLRWSDVSFAANTITIRPENDKSSKGRVVPMHSKIVDALEWSRRRFDGPEVFPFTYIKTSWNATRAEIDRSDLHLHDLRATFATRLLDNGVPLHIVQVLMGHSTGGITLKHYSRPSMEILQSAIDTLPDGFWTAAERKRVTETFAIS